MEQSTFLLGLVKLPRDVRIERVRRLEEKVEGISSTEVYESMMMLRVLGIANVSGV